MPVPLNKVKELRKKAGYSQDYMAMLLGIDSSTYGKTERGEILITCDRLMQIAGILEVGVMEIFPFKEF